jgi:Amino acid kinase family
MARDANTVELSDRALLGAARRVVVKVGSALLVDQATGRINRAWLETLTEDLVRLRKRGQEVILVSSGAIALGRRHLKLPTGPLRLEESQAAAAVGQIRLAHSYKELLEASDITVAQVLLTLDDTEQRRRYLNARATMNALLSLGAIPVINENDTVATAEIRYGDNDRLAARVAQMASADCLVLLPTRGYCRVCAASRQKSRPWREARPRLWAPAVWRRRSWPRRLRCRPVVICVSPQVLTSTPCGASKRAVAVRGLYRRRRRSPRASNGLRAR